MALRIQLYLFRCEFTLTAYEDALATCRAFPETTETVLMQVDCLVAISRRADAIELLEAKLHSTTGAEASDPGSKPFQVLRPAV